MNSQILPTPTIFDPVGETNDAIRKTNASIVNFANNITTDQTPVGGLFSSQQGHKVPPQFN